MALPQPRHLPVDKVPHERQRLWIMHDDGIAVFEMKPGGILK